MGPIIAAVIPALLPAVADGIKSVFARLTGSAGARPQNVDQAIALMNAETERLKTLAQLDSPPGELHKWVADLRALQRPALSTLILAGYICAVFASKKVDPATLDALAAYAQMVTFYLFGDRAYNYAKKAR